MTPVSFQDLPISAELLMAVEAMGFTQAMPIQADAIPVLKQGSDIIGQAQTGTGKTAAFGIPLIEHIVPFRKEVQGLVLCPTRELCLQVAEELKKLAAFRPGVGVVAIYGGDSYERQKKALQAGANLVVGTPGRVIDLAQRKTLRLEAASFVVLDEADEMLNMGFREDMEIILGHTPQERQTVMFSATMSPEIQALARGFQKEPRMIRVANLTVTNQNIEQLFLEVRPDQKVEALTRMLDFHQLRLNLVFCNQKRIVDELVEELRRKGWQAEGLHGDMSQSARNSVMSRFRAGQVNLLVATDVAARGIDVDNLDAVINYDVPHDPENYVHRIGRTGRAGKSGKAITLVTRADKRKLSLIARYTKAEPIFGKVPSPAEVFEIKRSAFVSELADSIARTDLSAYKPFLDALRATGLDEGSVICALVSRQFGRLPEPDNADFYPEIGTKGKTWKKEDRTSRSGKSDKGQDTSFPEKPLHRSNKMGIPYARGKKSGMVTLLINIGRKEKISPSHIVGAIAGESGIPGYTLGQIDILDKHTRVDVPETALKQVINGMRGVRIKGKRVKVELMD